MPAFANARRQPTLRRPHNSKNGSSNRISLSMFIVYSMVGVMFIYVTAMVALTRYTANANLRLSNNSNDGNNNNNAIVNNVKKGFIPERHGRDDWGDRNHPYKANKDWGDGVAPDQVIPPADHDEDPADNVEHVENEHPNASNNNKNNNPIPSRVLTAYLEPIDQSTWSTKPLPTRTWTSEDLSKIEYPQLNSCRRLPEQFPVDNYPSEDPFLPWIHDVFPTHDGKYIQFVAQNKQRCATGSTVADIETMRHMKPQVALFQHVAVKRLNGTEKDEASSSVSSVSSSSPRYRLSSHEDADPDGMTTRFICRFQPSGEETLSEYNFSYEYASFRKNSKVMFHEDSGDNKLIHTSQLTFRCPVPPSLRDVIRTGESVVDDYATLFVDVVPIRTPPRYGPPAEFLPPYYQEFRSEPGFDANVEWGDRHVLPKLHDAGRWENIPICKPSLVEYGTVKEIENSNSDTAVTPAASDSTSSSSTPSSTAAVKTHRLASCIWASTGYATRGNRFAINDGQRRLLEWIQYNKLIGVEHFYLYDNSGAFRTQNDDGSEKNDGSGISLKPIADMFPDDVTVIDWPSKVCNNNPNNVDSVGERSSQYAAEASCRLRFGPHVDWIAQFDIDEYLVPMGDLTSIHPLLDKLEAENNKIVSFGSWRAWPRRRFIEDPDKSRMKGAKNCGRNQDCFQLQVPNKFTMLQAYNCDRQKPGQKKSKMPAEKQLYRPDYVRHHFIHYSTVTENSVLNREDTQKLNRTFLRNPFPDPFSRFGNEETEGLMLHTKAVATQDTVFWEMACNATYTGNSLCRLGTPFPEDMTGVNETEGDDGWKMNCYVNRKIEDYWVKLLDEKLKDLVPSIASRMARGAIA